MNSLFSFCVLLQGICVRSSLHERVVFIRRIFGKSCLYSTQTFTKHFNPMHVSLALQYHDMCSTSPLVHSITLFFRHPGPRWTAAFCSTSLCPHISHRVGSRSAYHQRSAVYDPTVIICVHMTCNWSIPEPVRPPLVGYYLACLYQHGNKYRPLRLPEH